LIHISAVGISSSLQASWMLSVVHKKQHRMF